MQCAICGNMVDARRERVVTTTDGRCVHVTCADEDASAAWTVQARQAATDAVVLLLATTVLALARRPDGWALIVFSLGLGLHLHVHRQWWRRLAFRAKLVLRRRF